MGDLGSPGVPGRHAGGTGDVSRGRELVLLRRRSWRHPLFIAQPDHQGERRQPQGGLAIRNAGRRPPADDAARRRRHHVCGDAASESHRARRGHRPPEVDLGFRRGHDGGVARADVVDRRQREPPVHRVRQVSSTRSIPRMARPSRALATRAASICARTCAARPRTIRITRHRRP